MIHLLFVLIALSVLAQVFAHFKSAIVLFLYAVIAVLPVLGTVALLIWRITLA